MTAASGGRRREEAATNEPTRPLPWPARAGILALLAPLLATVAVGSRATLGATGGPEADRIRLPVGALAVPGVLAVLAVLAGLGLLAAVVRPVRRRRRDPEQPDWVYEPPPTTWTEKVALLLGLVVFVVAVTAAAWLAVRHQEPAPAEPAPATGFPAAPAPPSNPGSRQSPPGNPQPTSWPWLLAGVALLTVGAGLLARWAVRHPVSSTVAQRPAADQLVESLDASTGELLAATAPRQAILAAYARMERALIAAGAGRQRHETALEYLDRLLVRHELEPAPLQHLTDLFELARFSNHQVTEAMRDDALAALATISADVRGPS